MHILMTVNAAWNIWNFRRPLVEALMGDGHQITVLALQGYTLGRVAPASPQPKVPSRLPLRALPVAAVCAKVARIQDS